MFMLRRTTKEAYAIPVHAKHQKHVMRWGFFTSVLRIVANMKAFVFVAFDRRLTHVFTRQ